MGLLDHKTAVVTGANSGIGLATAERFIAEGAERVFITGRRQPELRSAAEQLGPRAVPVTGDVGVPEDLDRLFGKVAAAGKGLDVVVANAGSTRVARLGEISDDDLDTLLATNVKGVVYTVQNLGQRAGRPRHPGQCPGRRVDRDTGQRQSGRPNRSRCLDRRVSRRPHFDHPARPFC